jgi:hypothetical protein
MDLISARSLKSQIRKRLADMLVQPHIASKLGVAARRMEGIKFPRSIALGIRAVGGDFQIAVRLQHAPNSMDELLKEVTAMAGAETDIRYIGKVSKRQIPQQGRVRPLKIGYSIGQFQITAGTLGCFVKSRNGSGEPLILSNNHVLADENRAKIGDPIVQPGTFDGGKVPADVVGSLVNFEPLNPSRSNLVDCAVADITAGVGIVSNTIDGIGPLRGVASAAVQPGDTVLKTGRTTGTTMAKVSAVELDNIVIDYDIGSLSFDGQIEVDAVDATGFSQGGDSGSLVVNANGEAIGLLFAGSETGGSNGLGLTYLNPIGPVLNALNCDLLV